MLLVAHVSELLNFVSLEALSETLFIKEALQRSALRAAAPCVLTCGGFFCCRYLQWTFVSCEGRMKGLRKPEEACFRLALDVTGVQHPEQLVLIDDRHANIAAAAACGLETIHFAGSADLRDRLQQLGLL